MGLSAWAAGRCVGILKLPVIISVILSDGRNLESEIAAGATLLDSSLRCAAFRMTGGRGGCVALRMTGKGRCVRNDRRGGPLGMAGGRDAAFGMAGRGRSVRDDRSGVFRWWQAMLVAMLGSILGWKSVFP